MTPTVALLNRLLTIHCRSLPMYLDEIQAWDTGAYVTDEETARILRSIVANQQDASRRIAEFILDRHGTIHVGPYPMGFTDKNDLALDYLVREAVDDAHGQINSIQTVLFALPTNDAGARELAQECLGAAKAHVEELESLASRQAA
jgi:hypothetical protein